jgi:hypothetical protein
LQDASSFFGVSFRVLTAKHPQGAPGYPFAGIPLVNNPALLRDLEALVVTIKPSLQISTPTPTGIPPHVHHTKLTTSCLALCKETLTKVKSMAADVKKAVCDAIESKAFQNGIVTTQSLSEMLKVHHKQIDVLITERLTKALQTASTPNETVTPTPVANKEALDFAPGTIDNDEEAATTRPIVYKPTTTVAGSGTRQKRLPYLQE